MRVKQLVACLRFVTAALVVVASQTAEAQQSNRQGEAQIHYEIRSGAFSPALSLVVHGGGNLDLTGVEVDDYGNYNDDSPSVKAVMITLDRKTKGQAISGDDIRSNGLGATGDDGDYYLCCSEAAIQAGACELDDDQKEGEPIIMSDSSSSRPTSWRHIQTQSVSGSSSSSSSSISDGSSRSRGFSNGVTRFRQTSHVAVVFVNCQDDVVNDDEEGASLLVQGWVRWTSNVTPSLLPFFVLMTGIYVGLCLWYRFLMVRNKESRINVENWIFITLAVAALNSLVETTNLTCEVFETNEIMSLRMMSTLLALARHSVTRCLYLVLSLGLGVSVHSFSKIISFLVVTFLAVDIFLLWSMHMAFYMNIHIHLDYHWTIWVERIFTYWIPIALLLTTYGLWKKGEQEKLFRYKVFLGIYALVWFLTYVEREAIRKTGFSRGGVYFREANDVLYLFPLVCIAVLWKPNPEQQKYSYTYVLLEDGKEEENMIQALGGIDDIELTERTESDGYTDGTEQ